MKDRIDEDILVGKMLEETYGFLPDSDTGKESGDLFQYFNSRNVASDIEINEKRFVDFFTENEGEFFKLSFIPGSRCFRILENDQAIDFPSNWGPFKSLQESRGRGKTTFLIIHQADDEKCLTTLFCGPDATAPGLLFASFNNNSYLVAADDLKQITANLESSNINVSIKSDAA